MNTSDEITEILEHVDHTMTPDNPDGNPFLPGGISVAEAHARLTALMRRGEVEARIDELKRHDFQDSDDYSDREYARERLAELHSGWEANSESA